MSHFQFDFDVARVDYPSSTPDHVFAADHADSRALVISVTPWGKAPWTASFAGPDPGRRALTALLGTPSPTGLCVVERGTAFLGDVQEPDSFQAISTPGPVVAAEELVDDGMLLLLTPWAITAVGADGALWTTSRIAVDALRLDGVANGFATGISDPDDDEPWNFAVELSTGQVTGGSPIV